MRSRSAAVRVSLSIVTRSDADVAETCRRRRLRRPARLHRLAFSAVRRSPREPRTFVADRIARIPKNGRHARISGVFQHAPALSVLYFPTDLAAELKVQSPVVDRPRTIALHIDSVAHVLEESLE